MKKFISVGIIVCIFVLTMGGCGMSTSPGDGTVAPITTVAGDEATDSGSIRTLEPGATAIDFSQLSPITGTAYNNDYKPVLVMIENQTSARPQDGLAEADVVYEAMVEGGITRFMAVFQSELPETAGPIRSCRVVFADIAKEWDGLLVHFGGPSVGSYSVYQRFITNDIHQRLDGVKSEIGSYTDESRKAPHNKYMDVARAQAKYNFTPDVRSFSFTEAIATGDKVTDFTITYNSYNIVRYKFNASKNIYNRYQNGDLVANRSNRKEVEVSNIIIQTCQQSTYSDSESGHVKIDVIGSGNACIYKNGVKIEGTWKKQSAAARTVYYDKSGNEIPLTPGKTWVQIVSSKTSIVEK